MFEAQIENSNREVLSLMPSNQYVCYQIDGLDVPGIEISKNIVGTIDGALFAQARVGTRNIVIYLDIKDPVEANRIALYRYFTVKRELTIYFKNDSRDLMIKGYIESLHFSPFKNRQVLQISIICLDPYFKDRVAWKTSFAQNVKNLTFPISIEVDGHIPFSELDGDTIKDVYNGGDFDTGGIFTMMFTGDCTNPTINNEDTGEFFDIVGTFTEGDYMTINTNPGQKSVDILRNGAHINIINQVSQMSTWLVLRQGNNTFGIYADIGIENCICEITVNYEYLGV
jgi:phage-related protein